MTLTVNECVIDVRIDDDYGTHLFIVPVTLTYVRERETTYGADADGRRGVVKEEVFILDSAISHRYLMKMTLAQVEYAVRHAYETIVKGGV